MMDINSIEIKKLAKELGIDFCGVTDYKISDFKKNILFKRREKNLESPFQERDLNLRLDPNHILQDYKSIIVIGMNYYNESLKKLPKSHGRLSISSYGEDYHNVLKDKLEELALLISKEKTFKYLNFVDTGSLIDRELAYLSGIGYYGKNNSIITEKGSFIFIGYMITDLELKLDKPQLKDCGDCRLCIKACPTNALIDSYKFDYKKCISYLTQTKEYKGISHKKIGESIFGCDICQLVCPKNKGIEETKEERFKTIYKSIDIEELVEMSNREFKNKYGIISASWRGKNILLRNGIINLYNKNEKKAYKIAHKLKESDSKYLRQFGVDFLKDYDNRNM